MKYEAKLTITHPEEGTTTLRGIAHDDPLLAILALFLTTPGGRLILDKLTHAHLAHQAAAQHIVDTQQTGRGHELTANSVYQDQDPTLRAILRATSEGLAAQQSAAS